MPTNDPGEWETLSSKVLHDGWVKFRLDRLRLPDGEEMDYAWVEGPAAAVVLAFTSDRKVVVTEQYRHPHRRIIWDLPAGQLLPAETPEDGARRELREESGYSAGQLESLGDFMPNPGLVNTVVHCFVAEEIEPGAQDLDPHEVIEVMLVEWEQLVEHVMSDEPTDAVLGYCVLRYLARDRGK